MRGWKSTFFSWQIESGRPRYQIGKEVLAIGWSDKRRSRSTFWHLIGTSWVFWRFVLRPVASPKFCRKLAKLVMYLCVGLMKMAASSAYRHYVKTSNRSHVICNGTLTPVTSTHVCNGCCFTPVTYKRARTTPGLASTMPVTNVDFW
jgi:hypothetical protein